ncbi:MAG TPA: hypothetical protein VFL82_02415 [Thermomicrobiales bacterium]|nr:hypothetical protein [Thermomicrobiales bacterium]
MIVIDASVAAKWILVEEHSDRAKALFREGVLPFFGKIGTYDG